MVEHEPCGAGFDVSHPAGLGSGRVSMTCRGCGATYEYATATIEFEREVEFAPVLDQPPQGTPASPSPPSYVKQPAPAEIEAPDSDKPPAAPKPADDEPVEAPKKSKKPKSKRRRPAKGWSRDRIITAALLAFSAAALVFALIRVTGEGDESPGAPTTAPPAATAPTDVDGASPKPTAPAKPKPKADTKPAPKPQQKPAQRTPSPTQPGANEQLVETDRFSVIVPANWAQRSAPGGGTLLAPAGSAPVSLQIFYENDPSLSVPQMSAQTANFLLSRDQSAAVSSPKKLRLAGDPAFELRANGPAGSQAALGVIAGPWRYLVIVSEDPGTAKSAKAEAMRALISFQPR